MNTGVRHSGRVVTYSAPNGVSVDICTECERRLRAARTWPRNASGEFCTVSYGLHAGQCEQDQPEPLIEW